MARARVSERTGGRDAVRASDGERLGIAEFTARLLRIARKRWLIVLLIPLVGAVAGYVFAAGQPKEYEASATLLLRDQQLANLVTGISPPYRDPTRELETNLELVRSTAVSRAVAQALGGQVDPERLPRQVSVESSGTADLVTVSARDRDPTIAALIANSWAENYIVFRRQADRAQIEESGRIIERRLQGLSPEQRSGTEGQRLREQRDQLQVIASLQTGNAEVVDTASPSSAPVSPRPMRSGILAGGFGLVLAILCALLIERFDQRIGTSGQVEDAYGLRVLGEVPRSSRLRWRSPEDDGAALTGRDSEPFRTLRTNLAYASLDQGLDSLLVTSAVPGEGKTTIAVHLAQAFADNGTRTLLVEADLRRPTLAGRLGLGGSPGLLAALVTNVDVDELILRLPGSDLRTARDLFPAAAVGAKPLDVLPAGQTPPNPLEILESARFAHLMEQLRTRYEMVVVDAPPTLGLGDVAPLSRQVAGALVVARIGVATTGQGRQLARQLQLIGAPALGVVVNGTPRGSAYGYGYDAA